MLKTLNIYREGFPLCLVEEEFIEDMLILRFKNLTPNKISSITVSYRGEMHSFSFDEFQKELECEICGIDPNLIGDTEIISCISDDKTFVFSDFQNDVSFYKQKSIYALGRERRLYLKNFSKKLKYKKKNIKFLPEKGKDYWRCVCGQTNFGDTDRCEKCGAAKSLVFSIPTVYGKSAHDTEYLLQANWYLLLWLAVVVFVFVFSHIFFHDFLFKNSDKNNFFGILNRFVVCGLIVISTFLMIFGYVKYKKTLVNISSFLRLILILYLNAVFLVFTIKTAFIYFLLLGIDAVYFGYLIYCHKKVGENTAISAIALILIAFLFIGGSSKLVKYGSFDLEISQDGLIYTVRSDAQSFTVPDAMDRIPVICVNFDRDYKNYQMESLVINKSLRRLNVYPNSVLPCLKEIKVDPENTFFSVHDNILYNTEGNIVLVPVSVEEITFDMEVILPASLKECLGLKKIIITPSVKTIKHDAFSGCVRLEEIVFTGESSLTTIEDRAFENCRSLKEVDLPKSLQKMGKAVFAGCTSLYKIRTPFLGTSRGMDDDQLVRFFSIGDYLTHYLIPESLKEVEIYDATVMHNVTFYKCDSLEKIILPSGLKTLGKQSFSGCVNLKEISIPDAVSVIPENCFRDCKELAKVVLPKSLKAVKKDAFLNCYNLSDVTFPEGLDASEIEIDEGNENLKIGLQK